ncbi:MAG: pdhC [Chlamydiales bacterium]|jgi:pyruvate dehydrogenase E2 component (dihydrolipoamide acetyltransferase)|nr:pdhC [Chlamydiales bacterium]
MEEGTIIKWHKAVGDYIEVGCTLIEVATDKATVEYQAIDSGWLRKILIAEGSDATVNQAIAIFTEKQDDSIEGYQPQGISAKLQADKEDQNSQISLTTTEETVIKTPKVHTDSVFQPNFVPEPPLSNYEFEYPTEVTTQRLLTSPLAKRLAREKGLDLASVKGSGPNGRIMSRDLDKAQPDGLLKFGSKRTPSTVPGTYTEQSLTPMRKAIGKRLQESKSFIPHFYVSQTIDAEPLNTARNQLKNFDVKVTVNDFITRATALALVQHPEVNSGFNTTTNTLIKFETIDISIAVSIDGGLITPIIRHADYKNLGQLSAEVKLLAKKAKEGKLSPEEYKGGSFTISNLGMYGITNFQAIINPPQAAILAVSGIQEVPVVKNSQIVPGKVMTLTLSADHRVIDGAKAAEFLNTIKKYLENPASLLI